MDLNAVKKYYSDITSTDIVRVAKKLIGNRITTEQITGTGTANLCCDCPNHSSTSKKSLHISGDKQSWYCFGCGVGGDVLHLVEFCEYGTVSHGGGAGVLSQTHRDARNYLANYCGIPPLSSLGISAERLRQGEREKASADRTAFVMWEISKFYHYHFMQEANAKVKYDFFNNYAIDDCTTRKLLIGYAPGTDESFGARDHKKIESFFEKKNITVRELVLSGFFVPTSNDTIKPFFNGRIVFPYWSKGRVRFAIGRSTETTPNTQWEQGKYKKISCWNDGTKNYICKSIKNDLLYNEDCLNASPESVIITEGITDCIVLNQKGFVSISPVTVTINDNDWNRIIPKLRGVKTIYLCLDNEVSGIGLNAAKKAVKILNDHGIYGRIILIPLGKTQMESRARLKSDFGISGVLDSKEKKKLVDEMSESRKAVFKTLLSQAKTDPNEYFVSGGSKEEFEKSIDNATTITGLEIETIKVVDDHEQLEVQILPLIKNIAESSHALSQERELKQIADKVNNRISLKNLKAQLAEEKKRGKSTNVKGSKSANLKAGGVESNSQGTCLAAIREAEHEALSLKKHFSAIRMAEVIADWLEGNGGKFFFFDDGNTCLFFDNEIYYLDSSTKRERRKYKQFLYSQTGLVDTTSDGRTVIETVANIAYARGVLRKKLTWLYTDVINNCIFFNLNNDAHEIARISSDGVEILKNGVNEHNVLLDTSDKISSIKFNFELSGDSLDAREHRESLYKFIINDICKKMSCRESDAIAIFLWMSSFLLIDFCSTKPATRFEGGSSSGKTTAAKILTVLLYGQQQQKRSTDAANYADGARNPLICLDNIESKQMTDGLIQFILTSVTGIANEKRRANTESGVVAEIAKCLVNTTGIESLSGELSEIQSRTFTFVFDESLQLESGRSGRLENNAYIEVDVMTRVQQHRNDILSLIMLSTSEVLRGLKDGDRTGIIVDIRNTIGRHAKSRCDDYLSIMLMMWNSLSCEDNRVDFYGSIKKMNDLSVDVQKDTNHISQHLDSLFRSFEIASYAPMERANIESKYQVKFREGKLMGVTSKQLFTALSRVAKDSGIKFPYGSARHLAQRIANDMDVIKDSGFNVEYSRSGTMPGKYVIERCGDGDNVIDFDDNKNGENTKNNFEKDLALFDRSY